MSDKNKPDVLLVFLPSSRATQDVLRNRHDGNACARNSKSNVSLAKHAAPLGTASTAEHEPKIRYSYLFGYIL